MRWRWIGLALAALLLAVSAAPRAQQSTEQISPVVRIDEILKAHPLKEGEAQTLVELMRGQGVSVNLVQVRSRVRPHLHKSHEETVYVIEGGGILILGDRTYTVKAGALMMIPKGMVHSFEAKAPTSVLSIFNPPFDGADRIFTDEPAPSP